jgi:hypothetical protein
MKIHPVFHVSLLKPKHPDRLDLPQPEPPEPITVDGDLEYEVEAILDSKHYRKTTVKYLVHWKGYDIHERTWEPFSSLSHSLDVLADFHARNPNKPRAREFRDEILKEGDDVTISPNS